MSAFILACLGLQAMASFRYHPGPIGPAPYLWPFVDYPMYSWPRVEGQKIERPFVVGVLADSSRVRIEPEDLGLLLFLYRKGPVAALREDDREAAELYRRVFEERRGIELSGLELRIAPVRVGRDGYDLLPERTVASIRFEDGG